ncbi:rhodanese-like domain-containing protein [Chroococcidiopsis sp.]|uniref:rhodanese-like domain-containing protein n=1 Tax=Chroococcidiopsis sp. TaxID=3088168 RepID=UPI003F2C0DAF
MDKDNLMQGVIPPEPPIHAQSGVHELKSRLEWGEPAFTILDVRPRNAYNDGHIMGAMPMPMENLAERAKSSIASSRDIYVYGETDEQTAEAAQSLRAAGFEHVAELKGGFPAWKAIAGPTEGIVESQAPKDQEVYNVVTQLQHHTDTQKNLRDN